MSNDRRYMGQDEKNLPRRLRRLFEDTKKKQTELAEYLGVQRQTVNNYINGQTAPDWETVGKMAKFFEVTTDYLIFEDATSDSAKTDFKVTAKTLGLSTKAIENIRKITMSGAEEERDVRDTMNFLLGDKHIIEIVNMLKNIGNNQRKMRSLMRCYSDSDLPGETEKFETEYYKHALQFEKNEMRNRRYDLMELFEEMIDNDFGYRKMLELYQSELDDLRKKEEREE